MAARAKTKAPEQREWKLTGPDGKSYVVTSAVDYYNLKARGYADAKGVDNAKVSAAGEADAVNQVPGPADGATATPAK